MPGIPDGFRSEPPSPSVPWTDHWYVGPEEHAYQMVMQAKPWVRDDDGNRCELVVLNSEVCHLERGLALGWLQVLDRSPGNHPFDDAFDMLMDP